MANPVVESVDTRVVRKQYLSPREKGRMNFMERMREKNAGQSRLKTETWQKSKSKKKVLKEKKGNENPMDKIKCSPRMKKFISS